jgi:C4-dicarboxylate-specific signal transduction histidine kinase
MKKYIRQERQGFLLLFGLIAAVAVLATVFAVKKFFLNPLRSIQVGAEAIEKGDFKYQIPVKSRDEVGILAGNFNTMAQTLKRYFEALEDKNRQLVDQFNLVSRSQREWQETFDCITDAMVVIDSHCTILRANKAFREIFKEAFREGSPLPQDGTISQKCDDLFGACLLSDCLHKTSVKEKRPMTREIHGQQTGKIFEVSLSPYHSAEGDFIGSVAIIKDVTEKKETEMQVVMSERLAALGQMASGIAHELNNPLATIAACTEALLNRVEKEKIGSLLFESYLRIIGEEIERCKKITTSMLSFVRKTDNENKGVNINEALDRAIEMLTFLGRLKDVVYLRNFQAEMPQVQGNEGEMRQVFLATIGNALDAMQDKGTLTIETRTDGNVVLVRISDTGHGIPAGLINRIFDPFFSTKSGKGGTGLGLSIAKKIIEENHGKIDVISEEEKGATFTITLPI